MTFQTHSSLDAACPVDDGVWPDCTGFAVRRDSAQIRTHARHAARESTVSLRYLWMGRVGAPTVVVQGGISAGRDVCANAVGACKGWWDALVGDGRAIDLNRFRVLSVDWLAADELDTAAVETGDQADALAALLDALGIDRIEAFVGASYGAMVGLALAARHGRRLGQLIAIAGAHRAHPLSSAQRAVQRGIVRLGLETGAVPQALSLARQLAMTTYRGADELRQRFDGKPAYRDGRFHLPVEDWLEHVGTQFTGHFDARRYLSLSESIDLHAVDPATVRVPTTLIGIASDRLVPLSDLCALQRELPCGAALEVIESVYGHDAFLKQTDRLGPVLREALS
jgi:homoserine O-acetyltransferase